MSGLEKIDINQAHEELITEVFGENTAPYGKPVLRSEYTAAMHKVQDKYGLKQGHPQFLEWLFTCIGNSPIILTDEEGGDDDECHTGADDVR